MEVGRLWAIVKRGSAWALRAAWLSTMIITPLFGAWLASAMAAYANGSQWLSLLVGLLLFPILPVGWDLIFLWRMSRRPPRRKILTRADRLVLRTLLVNGVFIALVFWIKPGLPYRALSERGDWMLDGSHGAIASRVRGGLLWIADRMPGSWHGAKASHYGSSDDASPEASDDPGAGGFLPVAAPHTDIGWPYAPTIDFAVQTMPPDAQTSIDAAGRYFAHAVPDARRRVKAIHDFVTQRLTYDDDALAEIEAKDWAHVPSQDADAVFASHRAVCAGYAHLMTALGKASGVDIAYVVGYGRGPEDTHGIPLGGERDSLSGYEHAWNAARIGGQWYLIDATWDDGDDHYDTTYLFTPPLWFGYDHLPEEAKWQLLASPRSTAEFVREAAMTARFGARGLVLVDPTRSQVSVSGSIAVTLDNPFSAAVMATIAPADASDDNAHRRDCQVTRGDGVRTIVTCSGLDTGEYRLDLFAGAHGAHETEHVGSVWVNSR